MVDGDLEFFTIEVSKITIHKISMFYVVKLCEFALYGRSHPPVHLVTT